MSTERNNAFICYSHQDSRHLRRLRVHLRPFERDHEIEIWDDTKIAVGSDWREQIKSTIESAQVAILLVSVDFLASDFIMENELPPLLHAAETRGIVILPVVVGYCRFDQSKGLSRYQAANNPSRPLLRLPVAERERIWVQVAESVEAAFVGRQPEEGWNVANARLVLENLTTLVREGTARSFLIISASHYYVQFMFTPIASYLYCEAVSDAFLPEGAELSKKAADRLIRMGFKEPHDEVTNYRRDFILDEELNALPEIATSVVQVFSDVFKVSRKVKLQFGLELEG